MMPYERFEAWQVAHRLVLNVYESTQKWPKDEWYGLRSQLRRAATSVPTNIAEGSAKRGPREFRRYLDISIGSLSEVAYHLHLGRDLGYLTAERWSALNKLREQTSKLLWRLAESVAKR
jgi:four helix bundle protein